MAALRSSDEIFEEIQRINRQRDALREQARTLKSDLEAALIAEGKAVSPLANADLRDKATRDALRARLDEMEG